MDTSTAPNIGIIVVPRSCTDEGLWKRLIEKSKAFRLSSLQESPEAFGSTYEREVEFADEVWAGRLANPRATMLVAVRNAKPEDTRKLDAAAVRILVEEDWVATTVLIQPLEDSVSPLTSSKSPWAVTGQPPSKTERDGLPETSLFVLNGVYVAPGYRSRGVGSTILQEAFRVGEEVARVCHANEVRFQVRVVGKNSAAVKMYERAGFLTTSQESIVMGQKVGDGRVSPAGEAMVLVMEYCSPLALEKTKGLEQ